VSNLIQIKRSLTSATPGALANGEFAYTANGDVLYIGSNGAVVPIGGKRVPGVLTANQALVANATSGIDKVIVANLVPTAIYANGSLGTAGQLLTSNGTAVHWNTPAPSVVGTNTQIQFNDSGDLGADAGLTFNKTTDTLTTNTVVVNTVLATATVNATTLSVGSNVIGNSLGVFTTGTVNGATISVGTSTVANSLGLFATGTVNAATLSVGTDIVGNSSGVFTTGAVNGASLSVGTSTVANSLGLFATGTVNATTVSIGTDTVANALGVFAVGTVNATALTVGANIVGNSSGVFTTGTVNGSVVSVGTNVIGNSTGVYTTGTVNATVLSVGTNLIGNSAGVFTTGTVNGATLSVGSDVVANSTRLALSTAVGLQANGSIGTAGQVLHSNGTTIYWATDDEGVTSVASGNGITGGTITSTGTLSILANNGTIANTSGLFVQPGTGVTVNATGVHIGQAVETSSGVQFASLNITGNAALGDSTSDVVSINALVNTNILPTANITFNLGNNTLRWNELHSQNVHSVSGYFDGDVQISGNLSVLGTSITVNTSNLIVQDPLLQLAANNTAADLLDIGFFGSYNPDGGVDHRHTGLFRDATDDVYKLFEGLIPPPNNVVNTAGNGYTIATLQAYLQSSGFSTNATHVVITANSTVDVAIVANTLTLATALSGTNGGTGRNTTTNNALLVGNTTNGYNELTLGASGYVLQSNGTALVYDVLDGGTF